MKTIISATVPLNQTWGVGKVNKNHITIYILKIAQRDTNFASVIEAEYEFTPNSNHRRGPLS